MTEHFIVVFFTVSSLTYFEFAFTRQDLITACNLVFVFVCLCVFSFFWQPVDRYKEKNNSMASNLLISVHFTYHNM